MITFHSDAVLKSIRLSLWVARRKSSSDHGKYWKSFPFVRLQVSFENQWSIENLQGNTFVEDTTGRRRICFVVLFNMLSFVKCYTAVITTNRWHVSNVNETPWWWRLPNVQNARKDIFVKINIVAMVCCFQKDECELISWRDLQIKWYLWLWLLFFWLVAHT